MTVPQAKNIDERYIKLKDSIKWLNSQLNQIKLNNNSQIKTQDTIKQMIYQSQPQTEYDIYKKLELEMYRKMEVERYRMVDLEYRESSRKITVWFTTAAIALVVYFVTALNKL
jgi:hypothetical protein